MAFFDEIGKKITQTGQGALQKTKEFSEVTRINGLISNEEKMINNTYFQIGKEYVSLYQNDYAPGLLALVEQVKASETKIEQYRQEILTIKGVKRCVSCGAEMAPNALFCNSCGTKATVVQTVPAGFVTCGSCGSPVKEGMAFCTSCGKPLQGAQDPPPPPVPQAESFSSPPASQTESFSPAAPVFAPTQSEIYSAQPPGLETPMAQPTERMCSSCGAKLDADALFCTECGTKVE